MIGEHAVLARRRAYALLGALLVRGLDQSRLSAVRAVPALAQELPPHPDLDALAAEHYALLGRELPPLSGVFLDDEGLVGRGVAAAVVRRAHRAVGVECPDDPGPDHLGQMLQLMAVLADAELDARAHEDAADVRLLQGWQRRVLDEALLPWMPPLHAALAGQPASLWTRALELAIGVLAHHRAGDPAWPQVAGGADAEEPDAEEPDAEEPDAEEPDAEEPDAEQPDAERPDAERPDTERPEAGRSPLVALLDEPRTGLRTVAEVLATPARCGAYLAPRDLEALARACALPCGFGGRRDTLERLLRAAAEYEAMPRLVEQLQRRMVAHDEAYAALAGQPGLAVHVVPWRRRLAEARALLARLGDEAERVR